jgi:hypothetical protein
MNAYLLKRVTLQHLANYCLWLIKSCRDASNYRGFLLFNFRILIYAELQMLIAKCFLNSTAVELTSSASYSSSISQRHISSREYF